MNVRHAPAPSKVLGEIQMMLVDELVARPTAREIVIDRRRVVILQAALGEIIGQIEVIEEGAAAADRLTAELHASRAEVDRWKRAANTYHNAWAREVDRDVVRSLALARGGDVVDLTEIMRRERRAGQPEAPEGGAS